VQSCTAFASALGFSWPKAKEDMIMSLGLILLIILIIFLLGGFSGRFGGYGYGYGHGGVGVIGTILIIVVILILLGRI
jgi:hypothetical protein